MRSDYYKRWKSEISGPFSADAIKEMLRDGRVSKHHQISTEQHNWCALSDSKEFQSDCVAKRLPVKLQVQTAQRLSDQDDDGLERTSQMEAEPKATLRIANSTAGANTKPKLQTRGPDEMLTGERWYYVQGGQTAGPVSLSDLRNLVEGGIVEAASPICREGEQNWLKAREAFPGFFGGSSAPSARDTRTGTYAAQRDLYAGFWLRVCAGVIDYIISGIMVFVLQLMFGAGIGYAMASAGSDMESITVVAGAAGWILGVIANWLYFAVGESGPARATPGKRALDLVVTDLDGQQVSFMQATGRYFGKIISGLILMFGFFMIAFTEKKQGLHDIMAGTLVMRR